MDHPIPNIDEHHLITRTVADGLREVVGWFEGDWGCLKFNRLNRYDH